MTILNTISERILRLPQVKQKTGLGRSSIYLKEKEGLFPSRINLGGRSVGWLESEVEAWISAKIQASRHPSPASLPTIAKECKEGGAHA